MSDRPIDPPAPAEDAGAGGSVPIDQRAWLRDFLAGGVFVALGLAFAIGGSRYEVGSAVRMGPGYLPIALGGILAVLGLITLGQGLVAWRGQVSGSGPKPDVERLRAVPWARGALVVGAVVFFGLTVEGLGAIPTVFVTSLLAALAGQHAKPLRAVLTAVGVTLVTWLVFITALQLNLPLFGDWLGG